ncbi:redoxin domain-containing protein (plasmid) [Flammeovirga pectinis]|uniref:Redoxin domain-containing protein n=1 Tax=Flammeovirga pectinis TaxID=2494373 RepID=A0A3Q9FVR4_9BACT|nr:redoxin domain-containing protein [Flammeovirga pectinis]AZQ65642.1 redoxin domain-containing protein [Flammeovirga pectinis]
MLTKKNVIGSIFGGLMLIMLGNIIYLHQTKVIQLSKKNKLPDLFVESIVSNKKVNLHQYLGQKIIILYFNSECQFCEKEIKMFYESSSSLKESDIKLLLVSEEKISSIKAFFRKNNYDISSFELYKASTDAMFNSIGSVDTPDLFLYDKEGNLIKNIKGNTKLSYILEQFKG